MERQLEIGLQTNSLEDPQTFVRLAVLAEQRGIESIWFGEHSHCPTEEGHAFVAELPDFYRRIPDPYVVMAAIAASTTTIRIGTSIALPAQGDALTLAKTVATLDRLSDGRFEWGVGYGWNQTEMRDHGLDPRNRMSTFAETMAAVRELWHNEVASFAGDFVRFEPCWSYPKPAQNPHPPILLGCRRSPRAFSQLVEYCDGWIPSTDQSLEVGEAAIDELRSRFADAGRDPRSLKVTYVDSRGYWRDVDVETFRSRRRLPVDTVKRVRDLGADRLVIGMPLYREELMEPMLDAVLELAEAAV